MGVTCESPPVSPRFARATTAIVRGVDYDPWSPPGLRQGIRWVIWQATSDVAGPDRTVEDDDVGPGGSAELGCHAWQQICSRSMGLG